ncbi:MAG: fluoride efflux transporter CrcB [Pseudomonadota bacterium]
MTNLFLVMGGGAIGAVLRYQLGRFSCHLTPGSLWPWGTFAANLIGGFAMGLLAGWLARGSSVSGEPLRLLLGVGVLGGFTTFSAFSLETFLMIERGQPLLALGYALASVVGAVVALGLGLGLTLMRSALA